MFFPLPSLSLSVSLMIALHCIDAAAACTRPVPRGSALSVFCWCPGSFQSLEWVVPHLSLLGLGTASVESRTNNMALVW